MSKRTKLVPDQEQKFQDWYVARASRLGLDLNPDHPAHKYDYRGAFKAGKEPGPDGHWPSKYKDDDHPNRFVNKDGFLLESKKGKTVGLASREATQDATAVNPIIKALGRALTAGRRAQ